MNIEVHRADSRGRADFGWLKAKYSFSFANHYDPERMGFGKLLVLNDDIIAASNGFGMHSHKDMEIVSIPLLGGLSHKDSTGAEDTTLAGEVQAMSAGTGITHSEFNPSDTQDTHSLQLWIQTKELGIKPRYEKKTYTLLKNELVCVASGDKEDNSSLYIHQDAQIFLGELEQDKETVHVVGEGRGAYVFFISGEVKVGEKVLHERDAAAIIDTEEFVISAQKDAKVLVVNTPL